MFWKKEKADIKEFTFIRRAFIQRGDFRETGKDGYISEFRGEMQLNVPRKGEINKL